MIDKNKNSQKREVDDSENDYSEEEKDLVPNIKNKNNKQKNVRRSARLAAKAPKPTAKAPKPTANAADMVPIPGFEIFEEAINDPESDLRAQFNTSTAEYKDNYDIVQAKNKKSEVSHRDSNYNV